VYVNGAPFAEVSGISFTSQTPRKRIFGLDSPIAYELAPTTCAGSGSIELYRLSASGGLEGAGLTSHYVDLPREKYVSITVVDRKSGLVLFHANQCSIVSQAWQAAAKQIVRGSCQFEFIQWGNEMKPQAEIPKPT
jgi:hypothetical protein